jgi:hypothetical protein
VLHKVPTGTSKVPSTSIGIGQTQAIVVTRNGAVAWIVENEFPRSLGPVEYQVHAVDKTGSRVLASGTDVDPRSLVLKGSTMYWKQARRRFSGTLH